MAGDKIVLAFDAYGTVLSTESIAKQLAEHFGEVKAGTIAQTWRKYQLEYTWRLNSMSQYKDFEYVKIQSLKHALAESDFKLSDQDISALMQAYNSLSIFPDVAKTLEQIRSAPDIHAVVFSNGTQRMVSASVLQSPDLKSYEDVFKDVVTVEEVKKYKPAPEVYHHLASKVGLDKQTDRIWLVSGNPFDIVGARQAGFNAIWVNRSSETDWEDQLIDNATGRPTVTVKSLEHVVGSVLDNT